MKGKHMSGPYIVQASWDAAAEVWIATSEDVPGLCAEAATFEKLVEVVIDLVPDLLAANGVTLPKESEGIPITILAERSALVPVAA
ncbi:MAG: DUF1902 domain-containing protein [Thermodesulfobacteriota bacterium]